MGTARCPGLIFLGGFMSDMSGVKATAPESFAGPRGPPHLAMRYSAHGPSVRP